MNKISYIILLLFVFSCKKEENQKPPSVLHVDNVAPCALDFTSYDYDSVFHSSSGEFPNAQYRIRFGSANGASIELAFNETPVTGRYYMVSEIDPSFEKVHQVAFKQRLGAFGRKSTSSPFDQVYVEANSDYLMISFCDQITFITYPDWTGMLAEGPYSFKVKKTF